MLGVVIVGDVIVLKPKRKKVVKATRVSSRGNDVVSYLRNIIEELSTENRQLKRKMQEKEMFDKWRW